MLSFNCFLRSLAWLTIGIVFGLISLFLILFTSVVFGNHNNDHKIAELASSEAIVFLSLALMSGAGADFLLSEISTTSHRILAMVFVVILLLIGIIIFSPNNSFAAKETVKLWIEWIYCIFGSIYCVSIKTIIFYRERLNNRKLESLK